MSVPILASLGGAPSDRRPDGFNDDRVPEGSVSMSHRQLPQFTQ